jgi:hypothetical protein
MSADNVGAVCAAIEVWLAAARIRTRVRKRVVRIPEL